MKTVVVIIAILFGLPNYVHAQSLDRNYYSNQANTMYACNPRTEVSNVREGPSSRDFPVVSEIMNGQEIDVLERVQNDSGYDYFKIVYYTALGNGRLYENIGYVYHEALAHDCDVDFAAVVARNQEWPLSSRVWGCNFVYQDAATLDQWSRVSSEMPQLSMSEASKAVCEQAGDYKISVQDYLGFDQATGREYFHVIMNSCDAEFSIGDNKDGATFSYGWVYDQACLERTNQPQVLASAGSSRSGGFFSTWFNNMFGGAGGSFDPSSFSATYTLVCRDRVLFDVDTWRRGPSQECTGEIYQCQDSFKSSLEATYGGLSAACSNSFGSNYTYEEIDYDY